MIKRWLMILLMLSVIFFGIGFYLMTEPPWTRQTYYDLYNQGVVLREKNPEESLNLFNHIAANSQNPELKSLALFQTSVIISKQAFSQEITAELRYLAIQQAISILEKAVDSDPDNGEAKYNLELLKNGLPEFFQQMEDERGKSGQDEPTEPAGSGHGYGVKEKGF